MAGYLLPILTEIPVGLDCEELANTVYERLKWPDAVNDLSLPDPAEYLWAPVTPMIRVKFQYYDRDCIPRSSTSIDRKTGEIVCDMRFRLVDIQQCPDFIQSQLVREITAGIRRAVVKSTVLLHDIPLNRFRYNTPAKHPRERVFKSRFLYKMYKYRDNYFHAGHWMEHNLFGGIIEGFSGSFFTDKHNPQGSSFQTQIKEFVFIKVIAANNFTVWALDRDHYKHMGYIYDDKTRSFGPKEEIFHFPNCVRSRTEDDF